MIHVTTSDVGRNVVYLDPTALSFERGRISSIRENDDGTFSVWVRYGQSSTGALTPVERLEWDS